MKKTFFLMVLLMVIAYSYASDDNHPANDKDHPQYIEVTNKESAFNPQNILSVVSGVISIFALYYAKKSLHQNVKNRNLSYLSELDRMLIDEPKLWQFYDDYAKEAEAAQSGNGDSLVCEGKLRALIYYKLNHFEMTLSEENMDDHSIEAWDNYMIYCLHSSTKFTKEVELIILEKGYKGLFGPRFVLKLAKLYKEAFKPDSKYNSSSEADALFMKEIKSVINKRKSKPDEIQDYKIELLTHNPNESYSGNFEYFGDYQDDDIGKEKPIERIIKYYLIKTDNWKKTKK